VVEADLQVGLADLKVRIYEFPTQASTVKQITKRPAPPRYTLWQC
jgi:hypothetical protein